MRVLGRAAASLVEVHACCAPIVLQSRVVPTVEKIPCVPLSRATP